MQTYTYEGPAGWNVLRDMWRNVRESLPHAQSDKVLGAMTDYMFTGVEPQGLPQAAQHIFDAHLPALRKHRTTSMNGMKNKRTKAPAEFRTTYDARRGGSGSRPKTSCKTTPKTSCKTTCKTTPKTTPKTSCKSDSENEPTTSPLPAETLGTGTHQARHQAASVAHGQESAKTKDKRLKEEEGRTDAREAGTNPHAQGTEGRGRISDQAARGTMARNPATPPRDSYGLSEDDLAAHYEQMAMQAWEPYANGDGDAA